MTKTTTCPRCGRENIPIDEKGIFTCWTCKKVFRRVNREQLFEKRNLELYGKAHRN